MADQEHTQKHPADDHPSQELMQQVAADVVTVDEVRDEFPALWAHLEQCEDCAATFWEFMQLQRERGRREGHLEEAQTRRMIGIAAIVAILAVVLLAGGFLLGQQQSGDAAVNRVYVQVAPAVANIEVKSAGVKGSGFVFDKAGYLLTNFHVIKDAQNDQDIVVQLPGLDRSASKLVGSDTATDLAVLKVVDPPGRLTAVGFGNSDAVQVGDVAIAIGNPFGLSHTLTVGHISAVGRRLLTGNPDVPPIESVLQTDASINPGNSGGPLLNASGEVIGVNTQIKSPTGASVGIGFAIPSNTAQRVARDIIQQR
jgi:S1-C subfamily serine protease